MKIEFKDPEILEAIEELEKISRIPCMKII